MEDRLVLREDIATSARSPVRRYATRAVRLASDAIVLTVAAPFFAVWWAQRWIRHFFWRA